MLLNKQLANETETIEFMENNIDCNCPMQYTYKKWHGALGRFTAIRLCCMAKAIEKLTGEKLFEAIDFMPSWVWNCEEKLPNGKRGCPNSKILKRMKEKNIKIYHGDVMH